MTVVITFPSRCLRGGPRAMPRLRRADCSTPGIRRVRRGRGFSHADEETGEAIADVDTGERIRSLAIPPAWEGVWVCPFPDGHIPAGGTHGRGGQQNPYPHP